MVIEINNFKILSWNTLYAGKHWAWRQKKVEEIESLVIGETLRQFGKITPFRVPVRIVYECYCKSAQRRDCDNAFVKPFTDSLVKVRLIKDDSSEFVPEVVIRIKTNQESNKVIITINEFNKNL